MAKTKETGFYPAPKELEHRREMFERHVAQRSGYYLEGTNGLRLIARPAVEWFERPGMGGQKIRRRRNVMPHDAPVGTVPDVPRLFSDQPLVLRTRASDYHFTIRSVPVLSETSKMNAPSFSLPAARPSAGGTCPASKEILDPRKLPICWGCYALKGRYLRGNIIAVQFARRAWMTRRLSQKVGGENAFVHDMIEAIDAYAEHHPKALDPAYFRIHDSGDMGERVRALQAWIEIAEHFSKGPRRVVFWAPTREWIYLPGQAEKYGLKPLGELEMMIDDRPWNLVIRPSAFHVNDPPPRIFGLARGTAVRMPDKGPGELPRCRSDKQAKHCHCPAYESLGKSCVSADCRTCWDKPGTSVEFPYH